MITTEDVKKTALLAKLYIPEENIPASLAELEQMLSFADEIKAISLMQGEVSLKDSEPTRLRKDEVKASLSVSDVLKSAPSVAENCFAVRKQG